MGPDPPRKSLCRALFSLPPQLDVTARCSSSAACPARGTAVSLSLATCFFALAPRSHDHQGDSRRRWWWGVGGRDVLEQLYTVGGGGGSPPWTPPPLDPPPHPPLLPF